MSRYSTHPPTLQDSAKQLPWGENNVASIGSRLNRRTGFGGSRIFGFCEDLWVLGRLQLPIPFFPSGSSHPQPQRPGRAAFRGGIPPVAPPWWLRGGSSNSVGRANRCETRANRMVCPPPPGLFRWLLPVQRGPKRLTRPSDDPEIPQTGPTWMARRAPTPLDPKTLNVSPQGLRIDPTPPLSWRRGSHRQKKETPAVST